VLKVGLGARLDWWCVTCCLSLPCTLTVEALEEYKTRRTIGITKPAPRSLV